MMNDFEKLKKELAVLYPGVTDTELNEMTGGLIEFYAIAVKTILANEKQ